MKVHIKKILKIFIIPFILVFFYIVVHVSEDFFREVFNRPKENETISYEDSTLIIELINKNQFSDNWRWYKIKTFEIIFTSSAGNDFLIERTARCFSGSYKWKKASICQYIELYDTNANIRNIANRRPLGVLSVDGYTPDNWLPDIYINEYDSNVKCAKQNNENRCVINRIIEDKFVMIVFETSGTFNEDLIKEISIQLLQLID